MATGQVKITINIRKSSYMLIMSYVRFIAVLVQFGVKVNMKKAIDRCRSIVKAGIITK